MKEEWRRDLENNYINARTWGLELADRALHFVPLLPGEVILVPNPRSESDRLTGQARFYQFLQQRPDRARADWGTPNEMCRGTADLETCLGRLEGELVLQCPYDVAVVPEVEPTSAPTVFKIYW